MTLQEALYNLGVRNNTLTLEEKRPLDKDGFCILRKVLRLTCWDM